jgi:hypothetical protein
VKRLKLRTDNVGGIACLLATFMTVGAADNRVASSGTEPLIRGESLARQYCSACHLFPEPDLLTRSTWQNHTLRRMAPMLGVARMRTEGRPDGPRLEASGVFPPSPMLSADEWTAITAFYVERAPVEALPAPTRKPIDTFSEQFSVETLTIPSSVPLTTMVHIDDARREVWLGDASGNGLAIFDSAGVFLRRSPVGGAAVHRVSDGDALLLTLIGSVFPSDVPAGKIVRVGRDGVGDSTVILDGLERPVQSLSQDLCAGLETSLDG